MKEDNTNTMNTNTIDPTELLLVRQSPYYTLKDWKRMAAQYSDQDVPPAWPPYGGRSLKRSSKWRCWNYRPPSRKSCIEGRTGGRPKLVVDRERVRRLRAKGHSMREVASECGISHTSAARILKSA
jgi:hypothetical protein